MRRRLSGEEGIALVVVMILMVVMLTTGLALLSTVDIQTGESQKQRVRDSAFNLAESALNAQVSALSRDWPGLGRAGLPYLACTQTSSSSRCPDHAYLVGGGSSDLTDATWQTSVRDNGAGSAPNFYSEESTALQPGYDANNDGKVWVRARAVAQGRPRTLVVLVRTSKQEEDLPHAALIAGSLEITNNGNKELVRSNNGVVAVRCTPQLLELAPCLGHSFGLGKLTSLADLTTFLATQVSGATPVTGYSPAPAMTAEARARLKATAIADGTYYASCPTEAQLSGRVVYVESGNCTYTSNTQYNSAQAPGVLILNAGSITFGGTSNFHGVVYAANTTNLTTAGVRTQGNARVTGGVIIDGNARMVVGSSGLNIEFDLNAYRAVASYGSAGVIQNTWREIKAG